MQKCDVNQLYLNSELSQNPLLKFEFSHKHNKLLYDEIWHVYVTADWL